MRLPTLALALAAAAGCNADPAPAADAASATPPVTTPTPQVDDTPAPPTGDTPPAPPTDDPPPADGTSVPARFQGRYAADAAACSSIDHESELSIGPNSVQFHESSGPVTSVTSDSNDLTIAAELTGEGETRAATYRF